jgi:hypothetical protein
MKIEMVPVYHQCCCFLVSVYEQETMVTMIWFICSVSLLVFCFFGIIKICRKPDNETAAKRIKLETDFFQN